MLDGGDPRNVESFSILSRIVGTATNKLARLGCIELNFQYPQSDRGHCNFVSRWIQLRLLAPFSILSRIVGTATLMWYK